MFQEVTQDNFKLCDDLLKADTEDQVISILRDHKFWDDNSKWRTFDDNENNYSTIGAQQADPVAALVEKLINSIDAVLLRECRLRGVDPESYHAPQTMENALENYFGIRNGNLALISSRQRTELAANIGFVATGEARKPSYVIFDTGEGQTPQKMPSTFLSLNKSNKLRIPFVQGKYNMGGTGVMRFCGKEQLQLIISKRHPQFAQQNDSSSPHWGFTVVRRQDASEGRKSSMYTYLAPDNNILKFDSQKISIPVNGIGSQKVPDLSWGSIIKLYEYGIAPAALKTNILFDLYNYVSLLTPKIALPVRFYERRTAYKGHSLESTMSGLHVRLDEDRSENIEPGFPTSAEFRINGQKFTASIYAFKKNEQDGESKAAKYRKEEGIIFTINGQTHGSIPLPFFRRGKIGLSYIADSILIIVECDGINARTREDLFMNSRDRLSDGELKGQIEDKLTEILKDHAQLKLLNNKRRRDAIAERLSDTRPLREVLEDLVRKSPTLQNFLQVGQDIHNPFIPRQVGEQELFNGKPHPSYFRLMAGQRDSECHKDLRFRVQFETDVENEYFIRDRHPGSFEFSLDDADTEYVYNLNDGVLTLTVSLPEGTEAGDLLSGRVCINDDTLIEPFCESFTRRVLPPININDGGSGSRRKAAGGGIGDRQVPNGLAYPSIIEVTEQEWHANGFDKNSALKVMSAGNNGYDFYVNIDNIWLKSEINQTRDTEIAPILKSKFVNGLVLFGMALLKDKEYLEDSSDSYEYHCIEDQIYNTSRSFAPIIIPLVDALGELSSDNNSNGQLNNRPLVQGKLF